MPFPEVWRDLELIFSKDNRREVGSVHTIPGGIEGGGHLFSFLSPLQSSDGWQCVLLSLPSPDGTQRLSHPFPQCPMGFKYKLWLSSMLGGLSKGGTHLSNAYK